MRESDTDGAVVCSACNLGIASGVDEGQFCPLIPRALPAGARICQAGEPAEYIWFLRAGAALRHQDDAEEALRPGQLIGLESLISERYVDTVEATTDVQLCGATRVGMSEWLGSDRRRMDALLRCSLAPDAAPRRPSAARPSPAPRKRRLPPIDTER